jgi:hypothetical protein
MKKKIAIALALWNVTGFSYAEQSDITFLVAGKTSNHRQHADGKIEPLNYHFFAEIFLQEGGEVTQASLLTPLDYRPMPFSDGGYALELHGGRYTSEKELEATYPDGSYRFFYTSPSTGRVSQRVLLKNPVKNGSGLPAAPRIKLSQRGLPVAPEAIDPEMDLRVSWSEFADGGPDPLKIVDDLLFVIMGDCKGVRRAHSGRPFEGTPYLTYVADSFVIEAARLKPENAYQLSVEHAVLDTSKQHEVIAFATFATSTFLDIRTTGKAAPGEACPQIRKAFDAGQTDR